MLYFVKASDEGPDWIESSGHPPDLIYISSGHQDFLPVAQRLQQIFTCRSKSLFTVVVLLIDY